MKLYLVKQNKNNNKKLFNVSQKFIFAFEKNESWNLT